MGKLIKPDFRQNIVNISATLAEFLGCPNDKPILPDLAQALRAGYKNVVLLVLDGLGMHDHQRDDHLADKYLSYGTRLVWLEPLFRGIGQGR